MELLITFSKVKKKKSIQQYTPKPKTTTQLWIRKQFIENTRGTVTPSCKPLP
jgi:hypothetical protein